MIPGAALLPQDMVDVLDKQTGEVMRMHAVDAKHAISIEPDRYEFAAGETEPVKILCIVASSSSAGTLRIL